LPAGGEALNPRLALRFAPRAAKCDGGTQRIRIDSESDAQVLEGHRSLAIGRDEPLLGRLPVLTVQRADSVEQDAPHHHLFGVVTISAR
jgi:hypothetical protein